MAYSAGIDIMLPVLLALTAVLAVCCASFVVRVVTGNHKQFSTIKRINGKRTTVCKVVNAVKTFAAIALAILALAPEYTALLIGAILTLLTALINISLIITSDAHLFVLICTRNLMYSFLNCYRTEEELAAGLTPSESIDRLMGLIFSSPFILAALTYFDGYAVLTTSRSIVPFVLNLVISLVDRCLADNDALATLSMLNCSAVTALVAFHCYLKGIRAAESGSENSWVPFEIASFFLAYFTGILTIVQFFSPSSFNWLISALLFKPFLQPLLHYIIAPLLSYIIFPALQLYAICFFLPWIVVLLIIFLTAKIASACLIAFKTIVFVFTGDKYPDEHISLRKVIGNSKLAAKQSLLKLNALKLIEINLEIEWRRLDGILRAQVKARRCDERIERRRVARQLRRANNEVDSQETLICEDCDSGVEATQDLSVKDDVIQDELIDNNNDYEQEAQLISRMVNQFEGGMFM